jgi:lipopolysaccharide biosynthesis glycosyltransferase
MLVLSDLEELWKVPIDDDAVLGAVVDGAIPRCAAPRGVKGCRELGIPADAPYFNCGVLLVHLERWRRARVTPRAQSYLGAVHGRLDFLHQEALNAVLWRSWQPLPRRWNLLASHDGRVFGRRDAEVDHPGIAHFAGRLKPWRAPVGGPFNEPYQAVLSRVRSRLVLEAGAPIDLLYSLYDRTLRGVLHPFERALWKWRLI